MQDQSQEPPSRVQGSRIGSVGILSEHSWAAWSALDGHHLEVPIVCRPSDLNCKPVLMHSCLCFKGEVLETQQRNKAWENVFIAKFFENGKGWVHKRGDLKMPFRTRKEPEKTLKIPLFLDQGLFRHFSRFSRCYFLEKCLKNA